MDSCLKGSLTSSSFIFLASSRICLDNLLYLKSSHDITRKNNDFKHSVAIVFLFFVSLLFFVVVVFFYCSSLLNAVFFFFFKQLKPNAVLSINLL